MNKSKTAVVLSAVVEKIQLVLGIAILFIFGICTVASLADPELASDGFLPACLVFDLIGVILIVFSRKRRKLIREFRNYVTILSNDPAGSVANLAAASGTSEDTVRKNLNWMIKKKYFSNAALDRASDCIVFLNREGASEGIASTAAVPLSAAASVTEKVTITCKGCGGINTIGKGQTGECEYCGSAIQG